MGASTAGRAPAQGRHRLAAAFRGSSAMLWCCSCACLCARTDSGVRMTGHSCVKVLYRPHRTPSLALRSHYPLKLSFLVLLAVPAQRGGRGTCTRTGNNATLKEFAQRSSTGPRFRRGGGQKRWGGTDSPPPRGGAGGQHPLSSADLLDRPLPPSEVPQRAVHDRYSQSLADAHRA